MSVDRRELQRTLRTNLSPDLRVRLARTGLRLRQALHAPGLLLGGRVEAPIFIVGAPRSGTSLLFKVLSASTRVASWPGEAHEVWERDYHPALRAWRSNALDATDLTEENAARIKRTFYLVSGGRRHLLDKTPRNSLRIGFIDALFPDARYVFLQRDGRDNVNSLINAWRTPRYRTYRLPEPHSIPGVPDPNWWKFVLYPGWESDRSGPLEVVCAKQWVHSNDALLDGLAEVPGKRWTSVRYEDFIARPVEEIGSVMEFLQLPYEARVRALAARTKDTPVNIVTPPAPNKWMSENPREIEAVTTLLGDTATRLGYA
jgi:hypothetical protein